MAIQIYHTMFVIYIALHHNALLGIAHCPLIILQVHRLLAKPCTLVHPRSRSEILFNQGNSNLPHRVCSIHYHNTLLQHTAVKIVYQYINTKIKGA